MKLAITIILTCCSYLSYCQEGVIAVDITITDTVKPYFLDIYVYNDRSIICGMMVTKSGNYYLKDMEPGNYDIELHSYQSTSRRLYIDSVKVVGDSSTNLRIVYPGPCKFVYCKGYKPICPYDHADKIVKIVYGYPNKKTMAKAKKNLIYLGGCIISDCDPRYYCTIHKKEF